MSERMTDEMIEDLATALNHGAAIDAGEILDALVAEREEVERLRAELAVFREEEAIDEIAYAEYRDAQHRIAEALGFCASWQSDIEFLLRVEQAVEALRARCERQDGDPTVEELHRVVYGDYADAPIARALLRAWGDPLALRDAYDRAGEIHDAAEAERDKWRRIRTPTHGACCTCQRCGQIYDECRCDLDETVDELAQCKAELEALRARCERQDGDPSVDALKRQVNVLPADWRTARTARALLRAWGDEA